MKIIKNRMLIICLLAFLMALNAGAAQARDQRLAQKIDALLSVDFLDKLPMIMAWRNCQTALEQYATRYDQAMRMAENRDDERSAYILSQADDFILNEVSLKIAGLFNEEYLAIIREVYEKLLQNDPSLENNETQVKKLIEARITRIIAAAGSYLERTRPGAQ